MLKAFRGLVLATGAITLPLLAQADCPPEDSIDRYAQTAGDALVALHELVPASQQRALEDRYAAMIIMKWQWQGRDAIRAETFAMNQLLSCYQAGACGIDSSDQITTQIVGKLAEYETDPLLLESLLPRHPSSSALAWAQSTLGCVAAQEEIEDLNKPSLTEPSQETATVEDNASEAYTVDFAETESATSISPITVSAEESEPAGEVEEVTFVPPQDETATDPAEENTTMPAYELAPVEGDADLLMLKATNLVSAGKPQDAIKPLETACFIQAATGKKSSACETLFSVYTNSLVSSESSTSTQSYLTLSGKLCQYGYSRGCDNLSRYYAAQNLPESHRAAVSYAEQSCELSNAEACATVAGFYLSGRASEPDPVAARNMLEQSCRLGRLLSCQEVADYYLRGIGGETNKANALQLVEASCPAAKAERADLCVSAADFVLINETASLERSAQVRTFIKRACEIGHDVGCAWYAEDLELGIGGDVDLGAARQARLTACEYGDQKSCNVRS